MTAIELQNFLKENNIKILQDKFSIIVKTHSKYPNLHQFKYNQIESPMSNKIVQICRGIILDADNGWQVICKTFDKFFNYEENNAVSIDWDTAKVYEKLDGSLMQLFHYDNQWHVATSGSPDASGNVGDFNFTFKKLFWKTWNDLHYKLPDDPNFCYAFELMTPYNRVVVKHNSNRIVLLGVRNRTTGEEYNSKMFAEKYGWECVNQYNLNDLNSILKSLKNIDPYQQEGYVVVDKNFQRIKIKSSKYVAIHHVIGNMSKRNMLEIIRSGESPEFLAHFLEFKKLHDELKNKYENLINEIEKNFNKFNAIENQKDFAIAVKHLTYAGILFTLRRQKIKSIREILKNIRIKTLKSWLE